MLPEVLAGPSCVSYPGCEIQKNEYQLHISLARCQVWDLFPFWDFPGAATDTEASLDLPDVPCLPWDTLGSLHLIFWSGPLIKFKIQLFKRSVPAKSLILMWLGSLQSSTSAQQMPQEFLPMNPVAASKNLSVPDIPELTQHTCPGRWSWVSLPKSHVVSLAAGCSHLQHSSDAGF